MPLRLPLKPHVPPLAQQSVSPRWSVIVTVVLLKVASMKAIPDETLFFFVFAVLAHYSVVLIHPIRLTISFLSNSVVLIPLVVTIHL